MFFILKFFLAPPPIIDSANNEDVSSWMGSDASFRDAEFLSNMTNTDLNDVTFSDSFDVDSLEKSQEDAEDLAIQNLLKEHDLKQNISEDMTFLGDVEAPSGMFDQTIFNSTKLNKLTDIQRVGLLRPSTIIEEGSLIESETSRNNSRSIQLNKNVSTISETSQTSTAIQQDLTSAETTYKTCLPDSEVIEISEFTISSKDLETSSLSKTYRTAKTSQETTQEIDESSEIVEISDSDSSSPEIDYRRQRNTLEDVSSLIEDSSGYHDEKSSSIKDDEQNVSGIQEILDDSDPDQSISKMEFNDSLERMDYMMARGAQLLQQQSIMEAKTPTNKVKDIMSNPITPSFMLSTPLIKPPRTPVATTWNSNNKTYDLIEKTPTNLKFPNSPKTPSTVMKQRNLNSPPVVTLSNSKPRFERVKPTPTNSFKKPTLAPGSSRIPQKTSSTKKPNQYDYIVSPIGTYIKNSPYVPLHKNIKSHKSLFDTELCNRTRETDEFQSSKENKQVFCDLPRKAYISSDLQHVVDERVQQRIPGGQKIHALLKYNVSPSVIRHEGRFKSNRPKLDESSQIDSSFADLSMMSGDVSIQVLKNVKRV